MSEIYNDAVEWLELNTFFLSPYRKKNRTLDSANRDFCEKVSNVLDRPQDSFPIIQIAGSKGKGTTAFLIAKLLKEAGFKTGLSTSPHLVDMRERALVDFCLPDYDECGQSIMEVAKATNSVQGSPTFSGIMSLAAINLFRKKGVDVAVIECGLGGEHDSTGFLQNEIAVLTSLELEHTSQLGSSLFLISKEKASIVQENGVLFHLALSSELESVLQSCASDKNAKLVRVESTTGARETCESLALAAAGLFLKKRAMQIPETDLHGIVVPGRRDIRELHGCKMLFDGAHTAKSLESLSNEIPQLFEKMPDLIFSTTPNRDAQKLAAIIAPVVNRKIFVPLSKESSSLNGFESLRHTEIRTILKKGGEYLVTGSFHLVGEVMKELGIAPFQESCQ